MANVKNPNRLAAAQAAGMICYTVTYDEAGPYTGHVCDYAASLIEASSDHAFDHAIRALRKHGYFDIAVLRITRGPSVGETRDVGRVRR